jgi:hypothetical protein
VSTVDPFQMSHGVYFCMRGDRKLVLVWEDVQQVHVKE